MRSRKPIAMSLFRLIAAAMLPGLVYAPAQAENPLLTQGIQDYKSGDFEAAAGHLGSALSAEFSNPVLHYYLGNTYVRLNRKESAIKEFRIAYALDPEKQVGKLAKQALSYLGAETEAPTSKAAPPEPKAPEPPKDPLLEHAKNSLKEQAETAKNLVRSRSEQAALESQKRNLQALEKAQKELLDSMKTKGAAPDPKQLEALKQLLDSQKAPNVDRFNPRAQEIDRSASNLSELLEGKNSKTGPKLSPIGTNLYIRNYQSGSAGKNPAADAARPAGPKPEQSTKNEQSTKTELSTKAELSPKAEQGQDKDNGQKANR